MDDRAFVDSGNIISSLGFTLKENLEAVMANKTGIKTTEDRTLSDIPFPSSKIDKKLIEKASQTFNVKGDYTDFEKLAILSIKNALEKSSSKTIDSRTAFILATTKGNIDQMGSGEKYPEKRMELYETAKIIADYFAFHNKPFVVSNACISGLAAIIMGQRLINRGMYDKVIINGTDLLSKFIVSGFQSFMSLSPKPCRPFDQDRDGLSLGEASASIILTNKPQKIEIIGGATSNDANHISGPSRTGEGLYTAIQNTVKKRFNIDLISAHGTATPYNDDMESKAIYRSGLGLVPTNSLKGYFGHTLGAAGIIESLINIEALKSNILIATLGCTNQGTAEKINIIQKNQSASIHTLLKLASGFGGCNAAAIFLKHE